MIPKKKYIIMLTGESGSGKTTIRNKLKGMYDGGVAGFKENVYHRIGHIPEYTMTFGYEYTTRPPRPEEIGKTPQECGYKFVTEEELNAAVSVPELIREYHVINDGLPAVWKYAFVAEDGLFRHPNEDDLEVCIVSSNIDSYLLIRNSVELSTNFHINAIHLVVPYEVLLYRGISRELEKPKEKQNIQEVLRRFAIENNPGVYTKPFNQNLFTYLRKWLGPSDRLDQILCTNAVRLNDSIYEDTTKPDTDIVLDEIQRILYKGSK